MIEDGREISKDHRIPDSHRWTERGKWCTSPVTPTIGFSVRQSDSSGIRQRQISGPQAIRVKRDLAATRLVA